MESKQRLFGLIPHVMLPHLHFYFTVTLHLRLMSLSGFIPLHRLLLGQTRLILLATFVGMYVLGGGRERGKLALPCTHRLHGVVHSELKLKHIESRILRSVVSWLCAFCSKHVRWGSRAWKSIYKFPGSPQSLPSAVNINYRCYYNLGYTTAWFHWK